MRPFMGFQFGEARTPADDALMEEVLIGPSKAAVSCCLLWPLFDWVTAI
jgi:hypothetical protein